MRLGPRVAGGKNLAEARRREGVRLGDPGSDRGYFTCCNRFKNSPAGS